MALAFRDVSSLGTVRRETLTDELTGLPHRRMLLRRLAERLAEAHAAGTGLHVIVLDLDDFKQLNDTLGHHAGDELLRVIGPRLIGALRAGDTVGRLGGDEFAVLLPVSGDRAGAQAMAQKILAALNAPFLVEGLALRVTASLGIASYPEHAGTSDELAQVRRRRHVPGQAVATGIGGLLRRPRRELPRAPRPGREAGPSPGDR